MQFEIHKKTGFCGLGRVEILRLVDNEFQPFYLFERQKFYFNLPAGIYCTSSNIQQVEKPKKYNFKIPKNERRILPKSFKIYYTNNPNKASINAQSGNIFLDKKLFNEISFVERVFILFHELGHCYYVTEWKCDVFSANLMLKMGFNPSQIAYAPINNLTCEKRIRTTQKKLFNL